jgi:hypothetical protein
MIDEVIEDLKTLDASRDTSDYLWVDAIGVLEGLTSYEVDPADFGVTKDDLENDFLESVLEDRGWHIGTGDNSYNWSGNISHDFTVFTVAPPNVDESELNTEYSEQTYQVIRFHRFGDVRGNYTADIMLKASFEDLLEDAETFEASFTIEVDNKEFYIDASVFDEGMRVLDADSQEDVGEIYSYTREDAEVEVHWMLAYDEIKDGLEALDRFVIVRPTDKWDRDIIEEGFSELRTTDRHRDRWYKNGDM